MKRGTVKIHLPLGQIGHAAIGAGEPPTRPPCASDRRVECSHEALGIVGDHIRAFIEAGHAKHRIFGGRRIVNGQEGVGKGSMKPGDRSCGTCRNPSHLHIQTTQLYALKSSNLALRSRDRELLLLLQVFLRDRQCYRGTPGQCAGMLQSPRACGTRPQLSFAHGRYCHDCSPF